MEYQKTDFTDSRFNYSGLTETLLECPVGESFVWAQAGRGYDALTRNAHGTAANIRKQGVPLRVKVKKIDGGSIRISRIT
jgi:hypothetical protein